MTSLMLTKTNTDVLEERKRPPRALQCRGEARWRPLASQRISYQAVSRNAEGSGTIFGRPLGLGLCHRKSVRL